jgi:hypothetical protein
MIETVLTLKEAKLKAFILGRRAPLTMSSFEDKKLLALVKDQFVFGRSRESSRALFRKWIKGQHSK